MVDGLRGRGDLFSTTERREGRGRWPAGKQALRIMADFSVTYIWLRNTSLPQDGCRYRIRLRRAFVWFYSQRNRAEFLNNQNALRFMYERHQLQRGVSAIPQGGTWGEETRDGYCCTQRARQVKSSEDLMICCYTNLD